jgi:hypothetical protein
MPFYWLKQYGVQDAGGQVKTQDVSVGMFKNWGWRPRTRLVEIHYLSLGSCFCGGRFPRLYSI